MVSVSKDCLSSDSLNLQNTIIKGVFLPMSSNFYVGTVFLVPNLSFQTIAGLIEFGFGTY